MEHPQNNWYCAVLKPEIYSAESFKLFCASPSTKSQLSIRLLTGVMRKCFIQGRFSHGVSRATSQAADYFQSYPKCPALCNDFSRQLTGPVCSRHSTDFT